MCAHTCHPMRHDTNEHSMCGAVLHPPPRPLLPSSCRPSSRRGCRIQRTRLISGRRSEGAAAAMQRLRERGAAAETHVADFLRAFVELRRVGADEHRLGRGPLLLQHVVVQLPDVEGLPATTDNRHGRVDDGASCVGLLQRRSGVDGAPTRRVPRSGNPRMNGKGDRHVGAEGEGGCVWRSTHPGT